MGETARAKYEQSFTSDKNYDMLIALYEKTRASSSLEQFGAR